MKKSSLVFSLLLVLTLLNPGGVAGGLPYADKISPWVWQATADGHSADFLVILREQADLSAAYHLPDKLARRRLVRDALWNAAQHSQAALRAWLEARRVPYRSFYIVNSLYIQRGDRALVDALAARSDVARIEANPRIQNDLSRSTTTIAPALLHQVALVEPNIAYVNAPQVWAMGFTGQGVVIGGQDTGYAWTHSALQSHYRGWNGVSANHDYNWHDAIHSGGGVCGANSPEPCDDYGHGTHTMGIAVGDDGLGNQIGMAPGARWIGCRNMDGGVGTPATYLECFEFFLAPYPVNGTPAQGNPALAPDVTINSWTCPPSEGCSVGTLLQAVEAQRAAGIMTVVSAGNAGSACSTIGEPPAIYAAAYTVGALTTGVDVLAFFSSRGPVTADGSLRRKPDLAAPGTFIRSSVPGGGYTTMSGTSMAAPHVAGAVALLWSAVPGLNGDVAATEMYLNDSAVHITTTLCSSPSGVPNNLYGWGRLDVYSAVRTATAQAGLLTGQVRNTNGAPVVGAAIAAARSPTLTTHLVTQANGLYRAYMISDVYTLTVTAPNHLPRLVPDVVVATGMTTALTITLTPATWPFLHYMPFVLKQ